MTHAELLDFAKLREICATIAERTGCDVAIMGQEGKIIASSHSESIGLIHPGAALIMDAQVDRFDVTEELARESAVMHEG
ncbi:MAG: hypothetical protein KDI83_04300, partial [Gammaproteobacteria bacterium]|nr:hypothetical protein [Gammaproteobacteria bacterium]